MAMMRRMRFDHRKTTANLDATIPESVLQAYPHEDIFMLDQISGKVSNSRVLRSG